MRDGREQWYDDDYGYDDRSMRDDGRGAMPWESYVPAQDDQAVVDMPFQNASGSQQQGGDSQPSTGLPAGVQPSATFTGATGTQWQ